MTSIIGNIVKGNTNITDDVILTNMLATSKGTATAYLNATMSSTTPELRAIYSANLIQVINGHSTLAELAVKHGWEKPYNAPGQQLEDVYKKSIMEKQ